MVDRLVNSEGNSRRIAAVESCFGAAGQPLAAPGRVLVGEGTLTKQCRKGPKPRQFFLFNDLLVYGAVVLSRRRYAGQRIIPLEQVSIRAVPDEGDLHNGWLVQTPAKSFKGVYQINLFIFFLEFNNPYFCFLFFISLLFSH